MDGVIGTANINDTVAVPVFDAAIAYCVETSICISSVDGTVIIIPVPRLVIWSSEVKNRTALLKSIS